MRSLLSLLESAVGRSASEVVLESGQPVVFTTARGAEAEQSVLPRTELFDMIAAAVDDAQQVELAVGNPVEFIVEVGGGWIVHAEPGMEGMTVRARRNGELPSLDIELDEISDDELDFDVSKPAFALEPDRVEVELDPVPSQLNVQALDAPLLHEPESDFGASGSAGTAPTAPFESGTWALADEDEFDIGFGRSEGASDSGRLPIGFPDPPPSGYESAAGHIGVPDDDDDARPFDPFAGLGEDEPSRRRRVPSGPVSASAAAPPATPPATRLGGSTTRRELAPASSHGPAPSRSPSTPSSPRASTPRELSSSSSRPDADTRRELPSVSATPPKLDAIVASIAEGALVYVREPGFAEHLAQRFAESNAPIGVIVDEQSSPGQVWPRVRLPPGAIVIVRREDPSAMLGWILRRLEEGHRVFVETGARTPEGARRTLLGLDASGRAERWLDCQVTLVIEPGEGGPRVRPAT